MTALGELPARSVYEQLGSGPAGLCAHEAARRLGVDGPNLLQDTRGAGLVAALFGNLTHVMALLLWLGGGLALVAELPQLAVAVWTVNLVNGVLSTWQEQHAPPRRQSSASRALSRGRRRAGRPRRV